MEENYLGKLLHACSRINFEDVKKYCKREVVNGILKGEDDYFTPLYQVAAHNWLPDEEQFKIVKFLLDNGADPNISCNYLLPFCFAPLLHIAISKAIRSIVWNFAKPVNREYSIKIIELLLKYNTNVNTKDQKGDTPLDLAQKHDDKELIEILLKYGAKHSENFLKEKHKYLLTRQFPDLFDLNKWESKKTEHIESFLKDGYDINSIFFEYPYYDETLLTYSLRFFNAHKITEFLLKNGANPNLLISHKAPLHTIFEIIQEQFYDPDISPIQNYKYPPFHAIKYLIKNGANVNLKDGKGYTPLDYAIRTMHVPGDEYLKEHGAVHSENFIERKAQYYTDYARKRARRIKAIESKSYIVKLKKMVEKEMGIGLNVFRLTTKDIDTSLFDELPYVHQVAISNLFPERPLKDLVEQGVDINVKDKKGLTALDLLSLGQFCKYNSMEEIKKLGAKFSEEIE